MDMESIKPEKVMRPSASDEVTVKTAHLQSSMDTSNQQDVSQTVSPEPDLDEIARELEKQFEKLRDLFQGEAEFTVDKEIDRIIVKIKDRDGEIIRQIPPEGIHRFDQNNWIQWNGPDSDTGPQWC